MSELVAQLIWNGLVSGALIALVALGLTLIYGIAGFIQFAHGEFVALGAYVFMTFHKIIGWTIIPSGIISISLIILLGILVEKIFFKPVRNKDSMIPLVISIGLSIGLQSIILICFGANILTISEKTYQSISIFNDKILATPSQIIAIISAIILMTCLIAFLKKTKIGKSLRAVASNKEVAEIFGMNTNNAMKWIFGIGAGMAALSGIFLGFEQNLEPMMGVTISVKAFSAVILGAVGSVRGTIIGAFLIGLAESLLVGLNIIPSGFTTAIPFVILILMLLVRPEGLFGKRLESLRK